MEPNQSTSSFSSISSMISARLLSNESNQLIKQLYDRLVAAHNYIGTLEKAKDHLEEINNILTDIIAGQNIVQNRNLFENLDKLKVKEIEFKEANKDLSDLKKKLNLDVNKIELTTSNINKWLEILNKENDKDEESFQSEDRKPTLNNNSHENIRESEDQINNNISTNSNDELDYDVIFLDDDDVNQHQNRVVKMEQDTKFSLTINLDELDDSNDYEGVNNDETAIDDDDETIIGDDEAPNDDGEDLKEEDESYEEPNEKPSEDCLRNKLKNCKTRCLSKSRRKYNPDIHCGVLVNNSPCKYFLDCLKHRRDQKRLVAGRSKPFDELLRSLSQNTYVSKRKYDPDKHCGVLVNGVPCKYGLHCHIHWVGERKLVPGRSKPLEELVKHSPKVSKRIYDPDKHCGVLVNGQPCKYTIICKLHSFKQKNMVPGRSKTLYKLICEHQLQAS